MVVSKLENPYKLSRAASSQLLMAITLMNRQIGAWILTGQRRPFLELTHEERTQVLKDMLTSSLEFRRVLAYSLKGLILMCHYAVLPPRKSLGIDLSRKNANWDAIGYPGPDPVHAANPELGHKPHRFKPLRIADLAAMSSTTAANKFRADGLEINDAIVIDADVVIVGSGAGGGLCAETIAHPSRRVFILDKAQYYHQSELSLVEYDAMADLFEGEGLLSSKDNSIQILAGSTIGGGTAINWSCCLPTPYYVREEWAREHGLTHFISPKFADDIKRVQERLQIIDNEKVIQNVPNNILIEGCKRLGYPVKVAPQNTALGHNCGWCGLGCRSGEKQGSNTTYLVEAEKRGARLVAGCYAERIILGSSTDEEFKNPFGPGRERAVRGLIATITEYPPGQNKDLSKEPPKTQKIIFRCPIVVVSCGSLQSPLLLRRSGLTSPHIGRNLRLHPVSCVAGIFQDREVLPFQGNILTTVSDVVENPEGDGYGAKIEIPALHPSICAFGFRWDGSDAMKELMLSYRNAAVMIVIGRDKGSGSVSEDPETGMPVVDYRLCNKDGRSLTAGVIAGIKIMAAAGASKVGTVLCGPITPGQCSGIVSEDNATLSNVDPSSQIVDVDPKLRETSPSVEQLCASVAATGIAPTRSILFSAHQMGTCRMSASRGKGVVGPTGETWEASGLYVCDASVFPTPSGTNPMLTVFAIAQHIADQIEERISKSIRLQRNNSVL